MAEVLIRAKMLKKPINRGRQKQFLGSSLFDMSGFHICDICDKKTLKKKVRVVAG